MQQTFTCGNCGAPVVFGELSCRNCGVPLDWSTQISSPVAPPQYGYQPPNQQQAWGQQQPPYNQQQAWSQPTPYNQQSGWNQPPVYNQSAGPGYPTQYRQQYGSSGMPPGKKSSSTGITILLVLLVIIIAVGGIGIVTKGNFFTTSSQSAPPPAVTPADTTKPVISSFNASPASIMAGESSNLQWAVTGATSVSIDYGVGNVANSGTKTISPTSTTTYTLTATNSSGSVTKLTTVTVTALDLPEITSFTASPGTITTGMSSTLEWNVTGATSISIDKDIGDVSASGTKEVSPTTTTSYTLTAANSSGSIKKSATVTVTNLPVVTAFSADQETINIGSTATLQWDVNGATVISIDQEIGDVTSPGTRAVTPTSTTTYTLTAMNSNGTTTATVTIVVSATGPPVINSFTASYETITTGLSSTLQWNVAGASEISINQDIGEVSATGTQSVTPTASTTYTLTAKNSYGTVTDQVTISVTTNPVIVSFTANPETIQIGIGTQTSELQWAVIGATAVSINQDIGTVSATGTKTVTPPSNESSVTYIITASNSAGSTTGQVTITLTP